MQPQHDIEQKTQYEIRPEPYSARTDHYVKQETAYRSYKKIVLGVMLVVAGCVGFLDHIDLLQIGKLWRYAPLLMVGFGVTKMAFFYSEPRMFAQGAMTSFIGLWLFAVLQDFAGLTFRNSWPLLLIAFGVRILLEASLTQLFSQKSSEENHHAK